MAIICIFCCGPRSIKFSCKHRFVFASTAVELRRVFTSNVAATKYQIQGFPMYMPFARGCLRGLHSSSSEKSGVFCLEARETQKYNFSPRLACAGSRFQKQPKKKVGVFDALLVCFHVDLSVKFAYQTNVKQAKKKGPETPAFFGRFEIQTPHTRDVGKVTCLSFFWLQDPPPTCSDALEWPPRERYDP